MASKTTYRLVCDNLAVHGQDVVDGETTTPVGKPARVIELCQPCRGTVTYDQLVDLVRRYGRDPVNSRLPAGAVLAEPAKVPQVRRRRARKAAQSA